MASSYRNTNSFKLLSFSVLKKTFCNLLSFQNFQKFVQHALTPRKYPVAEKLYALMLKFVRVCPPQAGESLPDWLEL